MAAATLDLPTIEKGATFNHTLVWKDTNGTAINLTGYTARMEIRNSNAEPAGTAALATLTTEGTTSKITLGGSAGTVVLFMSATVTAALVGFQGVYDLELVKTSDGTVTRLVQGNVVFSPEVTKL